MVSERAGLMVMTLTVMSPPPPASPPFTEDWCIPGMMTNVYVQPHPMLTWSRSE